MLLNVQFGIATLLFASLATILSIRYKLHPSALSPIAAGRLQHEMETSLAKLTNSVQASGASPTTLRYLDSMNAQFVMSRRLLGDVALERYTGQNPLIMNDLFQGLYRKLHTTPVL